MEDESTTLSSIYNWQIWNVEIRNNYFDGRYYSYTSRPYRVVASSEEEAVALILANSEYVANDLLMKRLRSGSQSRLLLSIRHFLPISESSIGRVTLGKDVSMLNRQALSPIGIVNVNAISGKVSTFTEVSHNMQGQ